MTGLSTGQHRPTKPRAKILGPVDGRTSLIDRPINRLESTDKVESKNSQPGRWVNRVIDRGKYCVLKLFEIYLSLQYPVDGRQDDRLTPSTDPCLIALNALAVYTRCKGFLPCLSKLFNAIQSETFQ